MGKWDSFFKRARHTTCYPIQIGFRWGTKLI